MERFHDTSCIEFRPYQNSDNRWIHITGKEKGCYSYVGVKDGLGQVLNVSKYCVSKVGTIIHELLHALGFVHQHAAINRDSYIKILWENIDSKKKTNFDKYTKAETFDYGVEYDLNSVMHYNRYSFSKNGRPTIIALVSHTKNTYIFKTTLN